MGPRITMNVEGVRTSDIYLNEISGGVSEL